MLKLIYPAVFHEDDDGIWVEFPDLQGCQTFGETISETLENAREALAGYCITVLEEKRRLPQASDMKTIKCEENSFATLIETNLITKEMPMKNLLMAGRREIRRKSVRFPIKRREKQSYMQGRH